MFSEAIRRYGFWFVDAFAGGHIRKNLRDLEGKLRGEIDTSSEDMRKLLHHAVNTTGFYGRLKGHTDIRDFPVIHKSLIRQNYDQFVSSEYHNSPMFKVRTSGSTVERFVMLQDKNKRRKVLAELLYFSEQSGFHLGDRYVYVRVWNRENRKTKLVQMAQNLIMFDCSSLSDESLDELYELLKKDRAIKCLTGYAVSLAAIAFYFDKRGYTPDMFNIEIIPSGAERLDPRAKAMLKKVFGCPVVSRYSNLENGVLAQQPVDSEHFVLNTAHYYFETLKLDTDEPAPLGEPSRLVLTDLYNHAMPLIRYDTEDIVTMGASGDAGSGQKVLTDVWGRCDEIIYDTLGNKVHHESLASSLDRYTQLLQFQFVQESLKEFTLKLEGVRGLYNDDDISKTVRKIVGNDAVIKIEYMDKIPRLSSGKFKRIICHYKRCSD